MYLSQSTFLGLIYNITGPCIETIHPISEGLSCTECENIYLLGKTCNNTYNNKCVHILCLKIENIYPRRSGNYLIKAAYSVTMNIFRKILFSF